jgi:hypothetical protein
LTRPSEFHAVDWRCKEGDRKTRGGRCSKRRNFRTLHLPKGPSPPTHRTTLKRMAWGMIYLCGLFVIRVDEVVSERNGLTSG